MVEGDGVGPDDADGGGAGLDRGSEFELGEGDVGLQAGVEVVGGVDALASRQEGQPVGGVCYGVAAAVLASVVGEEGFFVIKPGFESGVGAVRGAEGGVELPEEASAGAGDVVQGDGELSATVMLAGDAFRALGDAALRVERLATTAAEGGGGVVLGGGAVGGGQGDLDASVDGAGLVGGVLDTGLGLAFSGDGYLPHVELGELLEAGFDGVGAFLGQGLVVGVVLDVVDVAHDGECSAVGILGQLAGDGPELGLGSGCQVG